MQWLVVLLLAAAVSRAEDECGPPPMGQRKAHPGQCCSAGQGVAEKLKDSAAKCMDKFPKPPKPQGPPPGDGTRPTPSPEMKARHACMEECVYTEAGALTSDKQLDKAAITKLFPDASTAVEKCFASYKTNLDMTQECKSGAHEFNRCLQRETFLNCPADKWTSSSDCDELKARVAKCPDMPFHFHGGNRMNKQ